MASSLEVHPSSSPRILLSYLDGGALMLIEARCLSDWPSSFIRPEIYINPRWTISHSPGSGQTVTNLRIIRFTFSPTDLQPSGLCGLVRASELRVRAPVGGGNKLERTSESREGGCTASAIPEKRKTLLLFFCFVCVCVSKATTRPSEHGCFAFLLLLYRSLSDIHQILFGMKFIHSRFSYTISFYMYFAHISSL